MFAPVAVSVPVTLGLALWGFGVDLVTIKNLLGRAQIHITADVYAHARPRLQGDAIEAMGNALRAVHEDDPPAVRVTA
jgi:hypothetical protein